ncbi:PREDICTED: uncharacterized protein LOC108567910 isoform X2 [Nicrophorus vespilloides]|uniref:Uncharacterized protein LOC108567910 isoform X2 n=1 Tax=Nicrophorus vespilloides TaxID=110193 RepID=A0ABM1NBH8_NICVS|nr:PREDICTED: uncharacterized protein LOC108567910 isoform X2 [Nicrophorus vespilloides]
MYLPYCFYKNMDNGAYNKDPEKGTELLEQKEATKSNQSPKQGKKVSQTQTQTQANGSSGIQTDPQTPATSCRPDVCQAARAKYAPPDLSGGPWHRKKTIFLGITLGSLILWIIIYSTLSKMNLL